MKTMNTSLKEEAIASLKKLVNDNPSEYDTNKLSVAINKINAMDEEEINCNLLLGRIQDMCVRDDAYVFSDDEKAIIRKVVSDSGLKIVEEKMLEKDDPSRDDFAIVTENEDANVIWVGKIKPLFDNGSFVLLGVGFNFPGTSYNTIEDLAIGLKNTINDVINDED